MEKLPYLVQRITVRPEPAKDLVGVNCCFAFDCMARAEFERDALPKALKRMQALPTPVILYLKLGTKEVAWFVGDENEFVTAQAFFEDQLVKCRWLLKKETYIKASYGKRPYNSFDSIRDGWWAIDMTWCLFKQQQHAELWLKCLKE